jgi:hypothetical protein
MFKADVYSKRRHPRLLAVMASAFGLIMLASGTAAAQGWNAAGGGRPGSGPYVAPAAPVPWHGTPSCGASLEVRPGMTAQELSFGTRGTVGCNELTGVSCPGYLAPEPICLDVRRATLLDIEVTRADVDTVLALTGNGLVRADDDGGTGTNSRITQYLTPGEYRLYPGTYSYRTRGSLSVSFRDADARTPEPRRGRRGRRGGHSEWVDYGPGAVCPVGAQVVSLTRRQSSAWLTTTASGEVSSGDRMGGGYFAGHLPSTAQVCLVVDEAGTYDLEVMNAHLDTVLGVVPVTGRGQRYFDDDGGSALLSRVSGYLEPGTYHVYVGTYGYRNSGTVSLAVNRR